MRFATFDIEAADWNKFLLAGSFDGVRYLEHESIQNFMEYCFSTRNFPTNVYAHFGGIYDFMFVIDFLFSQDSFNYYPEKMIVQGSKILTLTVRHVDFKKRIKFIDSSGLFPFGLKKLTHSFNVRHKKLDEDASVFSKITPELKKYLEYDCKGLWECLSKFSQEKYVNGVGLKLTRSGVSFAVYNKFFNQNIPKISSDVKSFARKAYFGGRTEIFRPLFKKQKQKINVYDINSLYPSVMRDHEFPGKFTHWATELDLDCFGIVQCSVASPLNINIPVLGINHKGKYIFPTGKFKGYFTTVELKKALQLGYKIKSFEKQSCFENAGFIFKDFVNHFYDLRKNTNCPVKKIIYKDILNHLYGRLAIQEDRQEVSFNKPAKGEYSILSEFEKDDYLIRLYSVEKKLRVFSNPVLSCFVTSYARLRLYDYLEKCEPYYCDTDSVFTTSEMESSNELGKMKLEYQLAEACFLLPKTYAGITPENDFILKMKGFPKKNLHHIDYKSFIEAFSGEIRLSAKIDGGLARLKTAMRKKDFLHVLPASNKELRHTYDKRIIEYKKGEYKTRPIRL